jgi:hypothetical protein
MAEKISSSVIDRPVTISTVDELNEKDKFGISKYEHALTKFIEQADTPLTIALQGEWGSGKTSLMNLLKYHLCEADNAPYYSVWINTWQHSIMSSPENAIVGILQSIIYQLGRRINKTDKEKKKRLAPIISQSLKIAGVGTANIAGRWLFGVSNAGSDIKAAWDSSKVQKDMPETGDSKISELRDSIADLINEILDGEKEKTHGRKGFLFFIDDLDRIDPPVAVQILELLKNIFDLEHCIYILAIDYDVVVKGLKPKFGELTDKNAHEFRSFFDKIIQLPFAMPVGSYQIDNFLIDALGRIGYLTDEEKQNEELKETLSYLARLSVGTNPRSLKRLTNILSLIQLMTEEVERGSGDTDKQEQKDDILINKQVNFGLVCLQITYPLVYNTLLEYPNFRHWGDEKSEPDDSDKITKISLVRKLSLQELTEEQHRKLEKQGALFDEPWEKTLFKICLKDNYLASRASDISQLLNRISEIIPTEPSEDKTVVEMDHDNAVAETIDRLIRFSAVTNVHVTEETVTAKKIEDFNPSWWLKQFRDKFVPELNMLLDGQDTVTCINGRVQSKLRLRFDSIFQAGLPGDEALILIGHDDKSYYVIWAHGNSFLRGGFESIDTEEQFLGCPGLHDTVVGEIRQYAEKIQGVTLDFEDNYNGDGRKHGSFVLRFIVRCDKLEETISDETVKKIAKCVKDSWSSQSKMILEETDAFCWGHDDKLREQLKAMDPAPFAEMAQWWSQTYLQGYKLGEIPLGISLLLRSTGFQCIIWEGYRHDTKHEEWILADIMKKYPALLEMFPEHKNGEFYWSHPAIIPFDSVIDWLKNLQELLKRLQLSNQ